ncbi:MAG: hypothetical protein JJT89_05025 [Nitriliruptoraceae bacterium]|nr:hypothetical protein [Nitriliruptoraceae bacterium]
MAPPSPQRGPGSDEPTGASGSARGRGRLVLGTPGLLLLVVAVLAGYALAWLVGQGPLEQIHTPAWVSRRVGWLFAPVTLLLAVVTRQVLPTVLSMLGLVVGVVVGEVIGGPVLVAQIARLDRQLEAGGVQTFEPMHPGWWIAVLVFVACSAAGAWLARRGGRHPA